MFKKGDRVEFTGRDFKPARGVITRIDRNQRATVRVERVDRFVPVFALRTPKGV